MTLINDAYAKGSAEGVNNNGEVVGFIRNPGSEDPHPFIWDQQNGWRYLTPGAVGYASGINDQSQVVGSTGTEAFYWDPVFGMRPLSTVIGNTGVWTLTVGLKINNGGQIIGKGTVAGAERNFFWDGDVIYDMGLTANYELYGLNDHGQVVGRYVNDEGGGFKGFRWDVENGLKMLNDIAPKFDWDWQKAVDINNEGQILADGFTFNSGNGYFRAWILTPKAIEPVIFVPGVGGSTLHLKNTDGSAGNNLWMSGILTNYFDGKLNKLSLNPADAPFPEIVAGDATRFLARPFGYPVYPIYQPIIDSLVNDGGYVEYETFGDPRKRVVGSGPNSCNGVQAGEKPSLFVFAYDWRRSNVDASQQLKEYVDCVQAFYPGKKVNLLTHSMGGLVARRYVLDNLSNHRVNMMVTIVAPWLGAPKAIDATVTGRFLGDGTKTLGGFYVHQKAVLNIIQFGKGPHELYPSAWYFINGGRPLAVQEDTFSSPDVLEYQPALEYMNQKYSSLPYQTNHEFHTDNSSQQDDWSSDTSGIKYYHIFGLQNCDKSIGQVTIAPKTSFPLKVEKWRFGTSVTFTKGDGTVPERSANRPSGMWAPNTFMHLGLKPPSEITDCSTDDLYDHNGILKNPELQSKVLDILDYNLEPGRTGKAGSESEKGQGERKPAEQAKSPSGNQGMNYLRIAGVDRLDITDGQGNTNTPVSDASDIAIDGISYEYGSKASESFEIPHEVGFADGKVVEVKFTVLNKDINIELLKGFSMETLSTAVRYLDLSLPANVRAQLQFTASGVENLRYDADGDGIFETEVQPTFFVTGENAKDLKAPQMNVSYDVNKSGTAATVTIDATDDLSGVDEIRYLIIGEATDHVYSEPFQVTLEQSKLIYFAAQDNVGNRTIFGKWEDLIAPTTTVSQTAPPNSSGWNTSDTTVELKATDNIGGSGIKTFFYEGYGAQYVQATQLEKKYDPIAFSQPSTPANYLSKTVTMHKEGITDFNFYSLDRVGNQEETGTYTVKIDKSLPISKHQITTNKGGSRTFTLTATDAISGVGDIFYSIDGAANQVYSGPFTVSGTGGHFVSYFARDIAGNEETARTVYLNAQDVAKSVLISEFRTRGLLGADDEFVELYNNGDIAVDISGWNLKVKQGSSAETTLATINSGVTIPARGHYLLRKAGTGNYSLANYAEADQTYADSLADNIGIALFSSSSTLIDAVGFSSVTDASYREGTGLVPSTGITTNGQYSFVRNYTNRGMPIDTNNNRTDFMFVATDGNTYNNLKGILGAPGPENLNSPVYSEGDILISQVDDNVTLAEAPNRFYNYSETDPLFPVGTISVRRTLTNNTGQTVTSLKLRITGITTKNSAVIFPQQAFLRVLNSADITVTGSEGQGIPLRGIVLEPVPTTGGGLNSSLTLDLGSGLGNGESLNINLKTGIVTNGQYKLEFRVEKIVTSP